MATQASNPTSASIQAQKSPRGRQSRRSQAARGTPRSSARSHSSVLLSGSVDPENNSTSSNTASTDSIPAKEASTMTTTSSSLAFDAFAAPAGTDGQPEGTENAGASQKPAWNKPSNGVTADVGAVMDAESWPALNVSARASPKSSSTHSLKAHSHGSTVLSQGAVEVLPLHEGKSSDSVEESLDAGQKGVSYGGNELQSKRTSFRRSNSGPLPRVDGSYHGGKRDHERGKQDWVDKPHRSFGSRESHTTHQRVGSRPFIRAQAPTAPFFNPPPHVAARPIVTPIVYAEMASPLFYGPGPHPDTMIPMPMVPIPPVFFPMPDPYLPSKIMNQIDYYFSNENLVRDTFLRQNMDSEGWVSIGLIAGFNKVMQLTDNIQLILDAIQASKVVEVQGDKVRCKGDWRRWLMPNQYSDVTSSRSISQSTQDELAAHLNSATLDEKAAP